MNTLDFTFELWLLIALMVVLQIIVIRRPGKAYRYTAVAAFTLQLFFTLILCFKNV